MKNIDILIDALNEIADYDYKSKVKGKCPYGCDSPAIARKALEKFAESNKPEDSAKSCPCKKMNAMPDGHPYLWIDKDCPIHKNR
jgi:hypothetical protein